MLGGGGNIIDSLFVALGLKVDTAEIERYKTKLDGVKSSLMAVGTIAGAAALGLGVMVIEAAKGMGELAHFAELNQMTSKQVAALVRVGAEAQVDRESMLSGIQTMNQRIGEAALKLGRGAMLFKRLGMSAKDAHGNVKSLETILGEVSDRMAKMPRSEQLIMARRFGIDPKMILVLEKGSENLRKMRQEAEKANPLSNEDYERAEKINILWIKAQASIKMLTLQFASAFFPILQRVLTATIRWLGEIKNITNSGFTTFLSVAAAIWGTLFDWVVRTYDALKAAVHWLFQFKVVTALAGIAVGVLLAYKVGEFFTILAGAVVKAATAMLTFDAATMLVPIAIGALIIATGLLIDELWNYHEGNRTVLGDLEKKYPYAIGIAKTVLTALGVVWGWLALRAAASVGYQIVSLALLAYNWIAAFGSMAIATNAALWPVLLVIAVLALIIVAVIAVWQNWDTITKKMGDAIDWVTSKLDSLLAKVKEVGAEMTGMFTIAGAKHAFEMVKTEIHSDHPAQASWGSLYAGTGLMGQAATSTTTSNRTSTVEHHTTINAPITIKSTDPAEAGKETADRLKDMHTRSVIRNGQTGVGI